MNGIFKVFRKTLREILRYLPIKKAINIPVLYGELLKNRVAFITGGTSGIGYAIANCFIKNGATVIITGRNAERINKTSFWNATEDDFDNVINTNLKGTYFLTKIVAKYMIDNKIEGNILNVSSSSSVRPALTSYQLAKWGLRAFTKGLAKELSHKDIVVNCIAPGPTATDMLLEGDDNINRPTSPIRRYATPNEIASLSVILVSNLARVVDGDTLMATGGCGNLTYEDWD